MADDLILFHVMLERHAAEPSGCDRFGDHGDGRSAEITTMMYSSGLCARRRQHRLCR